MMYELIRKFAYENFGSDYHVAPQGHNKAIQPLALIAKESLSCWRRATRRPKKIVLEGLQAYLANNKIAMSHVIPVIESGLEKGKSLTVRSGVSATNSRRIDVEIGDALSGHADRNTVLGELNLSSVQEEYYKDMPLRNILSHAKLDPTKMEPYEKNKLYIITGVVYSEKMEIDGKREEKEIVGGQVKLPRWNWFSRFAQLKADMSSTASPAPAVERSERSPLLFTYAKVKYNPNNCCLELQELVGAKMKRKSTWDVVADSVAESVCSGDEIEVIITTEEQWIYEDLMEISETKAETKLRIIRSFFEETESLQEMILRARNYKNLVDRITKTDMMAIRLETPLSFKDSELLRATGVEIKYHTLNQSKTLRVSAHNRTMVLDFSQIFYHLQGVQEEEWKLLKEFSGNQIDVEDGRDIRKNDSGDDEGREDKQAKKYDDIIYNAGLIKEDTCTEERTKSDKKCNEDTDVQEDTRNGVLVDDDSVVKEDTSTEEGTKSDKKCNEDTDVQEDTRNGVLVDDDNVVKEDTITEEGTKSDKKCSEGTDEKDISKEEQPVQEETSNEVPVKNENEEKKEVDQEELSWKEPRPEIEREKKEDEKVEDIFLQRSLGRNNK